MPVADLFKNKSFPDVVYFAFAAVIVLFISSVNLFDPININSFTRDVWHHMAVLNALMEHPFDAANPHIVSDSPSRTYMPWFVFLALIGKTFGLDALKVLGVSALITMVTLVFGVRLFAREYFQNEWAPLVLLAAVLGGWGFEFNYVGVANLETFVFSAGYPASIIIALGFFGWWAVLKFLSEPQKRNWYLLFMFLFGAFAFPTHHLQSGFVFGTMGVLAAFSGNGSLKKGLTVGAAVGAGLALSVFWIYYNPFDFLILGAGNAGWQTDEAWYNPGFIIFSGGVAYLGLLGFYDHKNHCWRRDLVFGFLAIFAGFILGKIIGSPISHRFYPFWIMFLQFGLTGFILGCPLRIKLTEQIGCLSFLQKFAALLLVVSASYHIYKSVDYYFDYKGFREGENTLSNKALYPDIIGAARRLPGYFKPGDVLIAHREVAYPPQAFGIKLVSIPRPFPLAPDMAQRQKATSDFFSEGFTNAGRWEIIEKYHVTHILYREYWAESWMRETFRGFGEEIDINGDLKLIVIDFTRAPPSQTDEGENRS